MKVAITAVRRVPVKDEKDLFAVRYTFTNLQEGAVTPEEFMSLITAKQKNKELAPRSLSEDTPFVDVNELAENRTKEIEQGDSIESVILYELDDTTPVELSFSQEAFPGKESTTAVVPE